jgi:desulfoferrodoxin-like iron-binding protein
MLQLGKRYACASCGTETLVTKPSDGELSCCGQPMELQAPKKTASAD